MIKRKLLRIVLLLYIFFALVLAGCGGGDSDNPSSVNDTENTTDTNDPETTLDSNDPVDQNGNDITANIWMTSDCMQDNTGTYFKSLYQFTDDNRFLYAVAGFDNDTCQGDGTTSDYFEAEPPITYSYQGEATMPDGTQGHSIQLTDGSETYNGYFVIDSQERLCVSYNLEITVESAESTDIDYEHCMVRVD
jgi:hypothetical protein